MVIDNFNPNHHAGFFWEAVTVCNTQPSIPSIVIEYLYGKKGVSFTQQHQKAIAYLREKNFKVVDFNLKDERELLKRGLTSFFIEVVYIYYVVKEVGPFPIETISNIPLAVMGYLGVTEDNTRQHVSEFILKCIDAVWDPFHQALESLILLENKREIEAGWNQNKADIPSLEMRIASLKEGQKLLRKFLQYIIPQLVKKIPIDLLHEFTEPLPEAKFIFPLKTLFKAIKEMNLKGVQLDLEAIEKLRDDQSISITEALKLTEKCFGLSSEKLAEAIINNLAERFIPHLLNMDQLEIELAALFDFFAMLFANLIVEYEAKKSGKALVLPHTKEEKREVLKNFIIKCITFSLEGFEDVELPEDTSIRLSYFSPVVDVFVKKDMNFSYQFFSSLVEKVILKIIQDAEKEYSPKDLRESIVPHVLIPMKGIISSYRNAFLYTFLAGLKKERAGETFFTSAKVYPSHFYKDFQQIVWRNLVKGGIELAQKVAIPRLKHQKFSDLDYCHSVALIAKAVFLQIKHDTGV